MRLTPHKDNGHELGLPSALTQLNSLSLHTRTIDLYEWYMDEAFISDIAPTTGWDIQISWPTGWDDPPQDLINQQLPCLTSLDVASHSALTDELLTAVLVHCRGLKKLDVSRLALKNSHAHWCVEGWMDVYVAEEDKTDMEQLERLPRALRAPYCVEYTPGDAPRWGPVVTIYPSLSADSSEVRTHTHARAYTRDCMHA